MNAFHRFSAILGIVLISVQAQAVDFSFISAPGALTQGNGNTYTDTVSGLTLTATAWSNADHTQKLHAVTLGVDNAGMGVCADLSCTSNTLDNGSGRSSAKGNGILFSFSSTVNLSSLSLQQFGRDSDLSVWAGTGSLSPAGKGTTILGTATLIENTNPVAGIRVIDLASFTGSYDWIAVAARIGQNNDLAKLQSLTVNPIAQPVPEAATWMRRI